MRSEGRAQDGPVDVTWTLAGDPDLRERLGGAGRAYVEEHLKVERVMPRYEQVFERAVAG